VKKRNRSQAGVVDVTYAVHTERGLQDRAETTVFIRERDSGKRHTWVDYELTAAKARRNDAAHGHYIPESLLGPETAGFVSHQYGDEDPSNVIRYLAERSKTHAVSRRADRVFDWVFAALPKRVTSEEIGDALEEIDRWRRTTDCKHVGAKITLKVASTIFFVVLNALRYVVSSARGKKVE
jgi:hypothetical protein